MNLVIRYVIPVLQLENNKRLIQSVIGLSAVFVISRVFICLANDGAEYHFFWS